MIVESLPVMLQLALLLFGIALTVYFWDLDVSVAEVLLVVTSVGLAFYGCVTIASTVWGDCPFKTPLSVILLKIPGWARKCVALAPVWLRRKAMTFLSRIRRPKKHTYLRDFLKRVFGPPDGTPPQVPHEDPSHVDDPMTLSNPVFWRRNPIFDPPIQQDLGASAAFWLLENSTDFPVSTAVAAAFSKFQWPSNYRSLTALIRLRDTYVECFRAPESKKTTSIKALESAAAYYVLYHAQLVWNTWESLGVEAEKLPPHLPPDLLLDHHNEEWKGYDVFEYLLHLDAGDRSEPVKSAQFLSYIAPYWFCGDSDTAIGLRPKRLQTLKKLVEVLEDSGALDPTTLTDCILCAGVAMDFPLHPEDLIRVDKRCVPLSSHVGGRINWR